MGTRQLAITWLERTLAGLDRRGRRRGEPVAEHLVTGMAGEDAAFFSLLRAGYTVVARRWSAGNLPGDIDIVAWQGPMVCFVEVKTRTARDMTPAETAVDEHKRRVLRRLARAWLRQLPEQEMPPVRFDVISVYLESGRSAGIVHFENAFEWSSYPSD